MSEPKTAAQRAALHLWLRHCSQVLNEAGLEQVLVIDALTKRGLDMQWTEASFKENIFKPVYKKVTLNSSTEEANTTDYNVVYQGLVKWFGQEFGVVLPPFPTNEG